MLHSFWRLWEITVTIVTAKMYLSGRFSAESLHATGRRVCVAMQIRARTHTHTHQISDAMEIATYCHVMKVNTLKQGKQPRARVLELQSLLWLSKKGKPVVLVTMQGSTSETENDNIWNGPQQKRIFNFTFNSGFGIKESRLPRVAE
jgi:hypothetical protein